MMVLLAVMAGFGRYSDAKSDVGKIGEDKRSDSTI
jgi:hypothetical protein